MPAPPVPSKPRCRVRPDATGLAAARQRRLMTQAQLAAALDYKTDYIADVERHRKVPSARFMRAAARVLRCDVADLFPEVV